MDAATTSNNASGRGLCIKGCGFYSSEETKNMCSKCYNHFLKTQIIKELERSPFVHTKPPNPSPSSPDHTPFEQNSGSKTLNADGFGLDSGLRLKSRCKNCNKKVGLTGFKCRCGYLFCGMHRSPHRQLNPINPTFLLHLLHLLFDLEPEESEPKLKAFGVFKPESSSSIAVSEEKTEEGLDGNFVSASDKLPSATITVSDIEETEEGLDGFVSVRNRLSSALRVSSIRRVLRK
ncbi:hypothetical protein LWI29_027448 [Acer saccharum]|uniref:A20-type domain-containing protein n=1 Tax=Acer saccharum TaxID=4024 RepID=A0AA39W052_ACESA|nr:hypothetical protein LWI29_027448 [Acer saccharum]